MPRKHLIPVQTEDEFKLLLRQLASDLGHVNDYMTLFKKLVDARQGQYWRGMSQSPAFWSTALGAMDDAACYGLARAYDQHDDSLSLRTLMAVIESAPPFLVRPFDFDAQQLGIDLGFVRSESNQAVTHLMIWRHRFIAQRDPRMAVEPTLSDKFPLTGDDFDQLLETGFTIVNRYDRDFFASSPSRHVHEHQDYLDVLNTVQEVADNRRHALMQQIQREHEGHS